jgi:hypothetical protein
MYKGIFASFFLVKGKVFELEISAGVPAKEEKSKKSFQELDKELQGHYDKILVLLETMMKKRTPEKNSVYLVMWEGNFLESGRGKLEKETEFTMFKHELSPAEFKKLDKKLKAEDLKVLNSDKNMDEPDYN